MRYQALGPGPAVRARRLVRPLRGRDLSPENQQHIVRLREGVKYQYESAEITSPPLNDISRAKIRILVEAFMNRTEPSA